MERNDMNDGEVIKRTASSECFRAEAAYLLRGGIETALHPRLLKRIDDRFVRLIFPTSARELDDGTVVAMVCLWAPGAPMWAMAWKSTSMAATRAK